MNKSTLAANVRPRMMLAAWLAFPLLALWLWLTHPGKVLKAWKMELSNTWFGTDGLPGPVVEALRMNGGAAKRLDEHRELWETLVEHAPELLRTRFWVTGWLQSQDDYLAGLRRIAQDADAIPPRPVRNAPGSGDTG